MHMNKIKSYLKLNSFMCAYICMYVYTAACLLLQCLFCVGAFYVISTVVCVHVLALLIEVCSFNNRERASFALLCSQTAEHITNLHLHIVEFVIVNLVIAYLNNQEAYFLIQYIKYISLAHIYLSFVHTQCKQVSSSSISCKYLHAPQYRHSGKTVSAKR